MVILKNNYLQVELDPKGAEIAKVIGNEDHINYMWKQDPLLWGHSAPILFPIVGALKNGKTNIEGKSYSMNQHGFSRNSVYEVEESDDTHVVFHLHENEETKTMYPYSFDLYVTYTLEDNILKADLEVVNERDDHIMFQIGGHPAFACPFMEGESANDYYVEFSQNETVSSKVIYPARGGMSHELKPLFENERRFFIRQALFNSDAIVVSHFKSESVALKSINHDKSLVFHMEGFDHLGLWTSNHVGGLLAIEPWVGHTDYVDFNGEFKDKEGIVTLNKGERFHCQFKIEINQ
jgi:galactose mutarotase-like enzyme